MSIEQTTNQFNDCLESFKTDQSISVDLKTAMLTELCSRILKVQRELIYEHESFNDEWQWIQDARSND